MRVYVGPIDVGEGSIGQLSLVIEGIRTKFA